MYLLHDGKLNGKIHQFDQMNGYIHDMDTNQLTQMHKVIECHWSSGPTNKHKGTLKIFWLTNSNLMVIAKCCYYSYENQLLFIHIHLKSKCSKSLNLINSQIFVHSLQICYFPLCNVKCMFVKRKCIINI